MAMAGAPASVHSLRQHSLVRGPRSFLPDASCNASRLNLNRRCLSENLGLSTAQQCLPVQSSPGLVNGIGPSTIGCSTAQRAGRTRVCTRCSSEDHPEMVCVSDEANICELPCLPFIPAEVFVPSSTKVLHLYEARFLALLDEVVGKYDNIFAHIVIEPMGSKADDNDESKGLVSFLATYGCLARVEKVKRLEIGAEVTIRGIGRIKLIGLTQVEPFLKGTIISLKDQSPKDVEGLSTAIEELQTTLSTVQQLQIKLKVCNRPQLGSMLFAEEVPDDELLQTPLERALQWAEKGEPDQVVRSYLPSREERVSFAALQPIAGASPGELHKLLQERLFAMEAMDTLQRLNRVGHFTKQTVASLAAKVSLQSLNL